MDKLQYTPPVIEEINELTFPEEEWKDFSKGKWCFGCSNCNCN